MSREEQRAALLEAAALRPDKAKRDERIRYYAAQGLTLVEIGQLMGVSASAVGRALLRLGATRKRADTSLPRGLPY